MAKETKAERKPIPTAIETEILRRSGRRCSLCFALAGDLAEKEGQIAHLDGKPSNNAENNLAFLCLRHHSLYDSTTSQHKNYTPSEVKAARASLYATIEWSIPISETLAPIQSAARDTDRKTLEDLLHVLPGNGTINFLRENNFAGFSFSWDRLCDLEKFCYGRNSPEYEFLDPDLEILRKAFLETAALLLAALSTHTFPTQADIHRSSVPEEWEIEQPDRFHSAVTEIHQKADDACKAYDSLVRTARQRLLK